MIRFILAATTATLLALPASAATIVISETATDFADFPKPAETDPDADTDAFVGATLAFDAVTVPLADIISATFQFSATVQADAIGEDVAGPDQFVAAYDMNIGVSDSNLSGIAGGVDLSNESAGFVAANTFGNVEISFDDTGTSGAVALDPGELVSLTDGFFVTIDGNLFSFAGYLDGGPRTDLTGGVSLTATVTLETVEPIPLPAAGWLLFAGLGGLAAVARRRV